MEHNTPAVPSATTYALDPAQLEAALEALRKAAATFRLTPREERLYLWLARWSKMAIVSVVILVAAWVANQSSTVLVITFLAFVVSGVAATMLLIRNLSLVFGSLQQQRLLRRLGLHGASRSAWKIERRRHLGKWISGATQTAVGATLLVMAAFTLLFLESIRHGEYGFSAWIEIVLFLALAPPAISILLFRMVQRSRERLAIVADADRLRAMLTSMQATEGPEPRVVVPAEVLEKVAGIENANIARERAKAVVASVQTVDRGYGLIVAHDVTVQKAALGPGDRLLVEDVIDTILADPLGVGVVVTAGDLRRAFDADGGTEIDYRVHETAKRVHVVALRMPDAAGVA